VRYGFSDTVHLVGETVGEKVLLKWIQDFRERKPMLTMLEVGIKSKKDDKPITADLNLLKGNGTHYIAPMNNYRIA